LTKIQNNIYLSTKERKKLSTTYEYIYCHSFANAPKKLLAQFLEKTRTLRNLRQ
jgi:hypothetical protein